jgi:hypothetical protein
MPLDFELSIDAFVRSVAINKNTPHAFFLGAGASVTSGIPSAASCIWEWKRSIFLTNNPGLEAQFSELSLTSVRSRIQGWLDSQQKYPKAGTDEEYGYYIQNCYLISEDRRAFFQEKVRRAIPHLGYRLLVKLAESSLLSSVWTTNFDGLTPKAAAASKKIVPVEIGIDCQDRFPRKPNRNELLCVSMHGDYRYDSLKNTSAETRSQEEGLRLVLIEELARTPLIVVGYSGRDSSIMSTLEEAYTATGTGAIYWCGFGDDIPKDVVALITKARAAGRAAYYIPASGFDDLLVRLTLHSLEAAEAEEVRQILQLREQNPTEIRLDFVLPDLGSCGIIKSNAFPFIPPGEIYEFSLKDWPDKKAWEYFKQAVENQPVVAAPFKGKCYAFGTVDGIRKAFGANVAERIDRVPINEVDLRYQDGVINFLIRAALIRAFAERAKLLHDGRALLWKKQARERRKYQGEDFLVHDALLVYLRRFGGKNYVVLKPTVKIQSPDAERPVAKEVEKVLKNSILGWQHNAEFNQSVEEWRKLLLALERYEFPPNLGSQFQFEIRRMPVLAKLTSAEKARQIQIPQKFRNNTIQTAIELAEPTLLYSSRQGVGLVSDPHPVRGIVQNRPFDYPLTTRQLASNIQLAVICPAAETKQVSAYLADLQNSIKPGKPEADYLPPFPGFQNAFGISLQIPQPGQNLWATCPEVDPTLDQEKGSLELSRRISSCLSALKAAAAPQVTVVFVPTRWAKWRGFETEFERFDLHNFIKAFCVPQGIATQFLEEDTFSNALQCRIRWWLSLAIYVKSMRTPWVLKSLNPDSAFVGLGVSLDQKAPKGRHVILGCSHLYNAQGQGLQFRLTKVESPIFRQRNAFMSFDDARRTGETIRQLFWESHSRLPRRVVVHKLTPFLDEERRGLQAGLDGVPEVDLIEIYVEDALRYLSSVPQPDGSFKEDKFPLKRGTLLKVDAETALLWVHGVSTIVNAPQKYYQGKRRIPAPLVVRRHAGRSDLVSIGEEIPGLSKMNWNSFDLYTQVPATIESSRQIARIGSLLERFGSTSYDYRLFM